MKRKFSLQLVLLGFVVIAPFLLFLPALISGRALFWGTPVMQFMPWNYLAFEEMRHGFLPLWNPLNGMGAPLLANYQLALFYPPNWLVYLLAALGGISWLAWGQTLVTGLHLSWAAAGMLTLARKLNMSLSGRLITGLAFGMSGYLVARVGFIPLVMASTWLPWLILTAENLTEQLVKDHKCLPKILKAALFLWLCAVLQLLSGHAQVTFYTLLLALCWTAFRGAQKKGWRGAIIGLAGLAGSVLLAAMTAAIQLLPTMEYLLESQRSSAVDYQTAMAYSFWPWRFLTLIFPDFFGNPGYGNYWGYANFWENAVYIGLLPLAAAAGTLIRPHDERRRGNWSEKNNLQIFLWIVVLVGFLLALGWNTPVFPFLFEHIPTFDMFNGPARFLIWVEFALAILAGMGIERWQRPRGRVLKWTRLAIAGSLAVTIGALFSAFILKGVNRTFIPSAAQAGVLGAAIAGLILLISDDPDEKKGRLWTATVVLLVAVDLFLADWKLIPFNKIDLYQQATTNQTIFPLKEEQRVYLSTDDEYRMKFDRFFTFKSYKIQEDWDALWGSNLPDTNILTATQMFNSNDPLLPSRFARMKDYLDTLDQNDLVRMSGALAITGIETLPKDNLRKIEISPIAGQSRYRLYDCAVFSGNSDQAWDILIKRVQNRSAELFSPVIIEGSESDREVCSGELDGSARLIDHQPGKLIIEVDTQNIAWLEIAETWYPGWKAKIDEKDARLYPSNTIFKAVRVPPGRHIVTLFYAPVSLTAGTLISSIGLMIAGFVLYLSKRQKKA